METTTPTTKETVSTTETSTTTVTPTSTQPTKTTQATPHKTSTGMNILTIILLIFLPLIGLIVMWAGTKWSKTVKWVLTIIYILMIPVILFFFGVLATAILVAVNPAEQYARARMVTAANDTAQILEAADTYLAINKTYPTTIDQLIAAGLLKATIKDNVDITYLIKPSADGKDCEVTVIMGNKAPVVVTCEKKDLSVFQITPEN